MEQWRKDARKEPIIKVYDDVTRKHNVQFVTMDAGYKTPWIVKKILDDGKVPSVGFDFTISRAPARVASTG